MKVRTRARSHGLASAAAARTKLGCLVRSGKCMTKILQQLISSGRGCSDWSGKGVRMATRARGRSTRARTRRRDGKGA
ncbi:hypothetical protein MPTK1_5g11760 [Marchantia polymorpha subsp. ruderalis]|uniref:Uncharacterized protein n=2 Tax=Marchantia polymorpha TaxID=3197 RepID=A0AAF6BHD9_MARPO|nr:hypothetical protein MARPO_0143s0005 [Marchantia polymorpha]BBN11423.1 hypothetical protein Mp_5g11760 [Marchantia polymorpha subsp. ruderalis]|eukprot:PTQ29322.1 hypothetical protein MARPO_0143s0005 [Marchantia polymorpha]